MSDLVPAGPFHAEVLAAIHASAFPLGQRWGADTFRLQLDQPGAAGWLCGTAGFVLFRVAADEAEIITLAVHGDRRRSGAGRSLLARAVESVSDAGARALFLEVEDGNQAAWCLYASAGFVEVGRRPRYYPGGADARVLRLSIGAAPP